MPMYDYICECGKEFEALQRMDDRMTATCDCGEQARMVISPVRCSLDGTDPDFPGEYQKWERKRKQHMSIERKQEE